MAGQDEIQVPGPDQAYDFLYQQIHAPVFFTKLAQDYGIVPRDEAEAGRLLAMAADLFAAEQQDREKRAGLQGSFIGEAHDSLQRLLGKQADARNPDAPANDRLVKAAAAELTRDPHVRAAALAYQMYLAQQQG
jgi:hypothetical protein